MLFIQYYPLLFIVFPYCYYFFRNFLKPWSGSSAVSNKVTSCSRIEFYGDYGIVRFNFQQLDCLTLHSNKFGRISSQDFCFFSQVMAIFFAGWEIGLRV